MNYGDRRLEDVDAFEKERALFGEERFEDRQVQHRRIELDLQRLIEEGVVGVTSVQLLPIHAFVQDRRTGEVLQALLRSTC